MPTSDGSIPLTLFIWILLPPDQTLACQLPRRPASAEGTDPSCETRLRAGQTASDFWPVWLLFRSDGDPRCVSC